MYCVEKEGIFLQREAWVPTPNGVGERGPRTRTARTTQAAEAGPAICGGIVARHRAAGVVFASTHPDTENL